MGLISEQGKTFQSTTVLWIWALWSEGKGTTWKNLLLVAHTLCRLYLLDLYTHSSVEQERVCEHATIAAHLWWEAVGNLTIHGSGWNATDKTIHTPGMTTKGGKGHLCAAIIHLMVAQSESKQMSRPSGAPQYWNLWPRQKAVINSAALLWPMFVCLWQKISGSVKLTRFSSLPGAGVPQAWGGWSCTPV